MNWIKHPALLKGQHVSLVPLNESHIAELVELAQDKSIWKHYAIDGSDKDKLKTSLEQGIADREGGTQYPFVIQLNENGQLIGSTRFLDIQENHQKLEIGWTWLHPDYWGTNINTECKYLLLTFCFEELQAKRVQLRTDENNLRSRKAIEKIGGQFEGILRNDMVRDNGTTRNSAYFSIIPEEWQQTKAQLQELLASE
ncbi:GNAT family N-acetyltransferase [Fluviicola sp.]|uniref:GNAT family N-acetyltransferase n=1 Tax=Fluviicola sp. TaxID=1917219 RepID=UPI0031DD2606